MTQEFANKCKAFDAEYSKMRDKQHELDEVHYKLPTNENFVEVLNQRIKVNDFVKQFRKELYSAYKNGECTMNEYFNALSTTGISDYGLSIKIMDGLESEIGICRDHETKRLRLYGYIHDDLDEYEPTTLNAIRSRIKYLEHKLEEEMKRDPDSEYVLDIRANLEEYKEALPKAIEKEEHEFITKEKALELAAFFTRLAEEL